MELQNKDALFPKDSDGRSFSKDWFYMNLDNGETMLRTWLMFSPVKCAAYCFPCMLFQKAKRKSSFGKPSGFNAWRKLNPRLLEHERSSYHLSAFTMWKSADVITKQICDKLQADGLKLEYCYGQRYDNAATMAGRISGVQKHILDMNPKAVFVPCNNHSLNLAGVHAVGVGTQSVTLFGTVENVYTFFLSSTHRWDETCTNSCKAIM